MPLKHFICLEYLRGLLYRNSVPYRITVRIDVIANILRLLIEFFFFFGVCEARYIHVGHPTCLKSN